MMFLSLQAANSKELFEFQKPYFAHKESLGEIKYWHDYYIMVLLDFQTFKQLLLELPLNTLGFGLQLMLDPWPAIPRQYMFVLSMGIQ